MPFLKLSKRHILKTITWRIIGTLDTMLLSYIITGNIVTGIKISLFELITKLVLYYLHERIWFNSNFNNSSMRHIYKTFSWRFVGTADTIILGWIISGNAFIGLKIGFFEIITKMIFYYLHEKIWYKLKFGLKDNIKI